MSIQYQGFIKGPIFGQNLRRQHAPLSYPPLPADLLRKKSQGQPTITIYPQHPYVINLFSLGSSVAIICSNLYCLIIVYKNIHMISFLLNILVNKLLVIQMNIQAFTHDPLFVETARRMGYRKQDLQPLTKQKIYQESYKTIKDLTQQQKDFYLQKKLEAMQLRQNKIITQITQQMHRNNVNTDKNKKGFNPVIKKLLQDHELRLQKKARYQQIARISKTRETQNRKVNNTIDFGRTSPNFSNASKNSRVSKQSIRSQNSRASSRSNSSHRDRLQLVRLRQKQQQKFKKNLLRHNQLEKRKKVEKVHQSRLSLSRRLKTKSQISQQAVHQKKSQLQSIRKSQIREHIEKLKYKMIKNQYLKRKQEERKINQSISHESAYKKQLKNMFQHNERELNKARYEQKFKSAQRKKKQIQQQRKLESEHRLREKKQKQLHVLKYREHMKIQEHERNRQTLYYEISDLERAKIKKQKILSEKKMRLIQNKVKQEITRSNFNSIQNRKKMESQARARHIDERMQQITDIEEIKKRLTRQKNRNIFNRMQDQDRKKLFY